ncbi:MAG TPA: hypothetical protein VNW04_12870 [Puia sp.]|jgi:hypothetical protein|nr:hypothetical protein [Puia sp.]
MTEDVLPKYVFRGTTIGFEGNTASMNMPYTCTSSHPIKALWFALDCMSNNPYTAIVYLGILDRISGQLIKGNVLDSIEEEIAFGMKPHEFYNLCEGYVHVADLQSIVKTHGFDTYMSVRKDNLSLLCEETRQITQDEIS